MKTSPEIRAQQYGLAGQIMGLTARSLGVDISSDTLAGWVNSSARLAGADDISEIEPDRLSPETLLEMLDLQDPNTALNNAATQLLTASRDALAAPTLKSYFAAREREAIGTTDLLRYQSPSHISSENHLWDQLGSLVVTGIHFDTLIDCREDANQLPQFTTIQLARGSFMHMLRAARKLEGATVKACAGACHDVGIDIQIIKRLPKPLFADA